MPKQPREKLLLVDAHALLHRSYHALPSTMTGPDGAPTNALYGFSLTFLTAVETFRPTHVAVCFDAAEVTLRAQKFEAYKAHRKETEDLLVQQLDRAREIPVAFGVKIFFGNGHEADDYLGALAACGKAQDMDVVILTGDKDTYQLIDERVSVCTLRTGVKDTVLMTPERVLEVTGLRPDQMIDYKALRGDPSDNIPGVPGVGDVTATKLLQRHGTLDSVYLNLEIDPEIKGKLKERLIKHKSLAYLSQELATIQCDVALSCELGELAFAPDPDAVAEAFRAFGFTSLLGRAAKLQRTEVTPAPAKRPPSATQNDDALQPSLFAPAESAGAVRAPRKQQGAFAFRHVLITTEAALRDVAAELRAAGRFAVDTETPALDPLGRTPCGISLCADPAVGYYVNIGHAGEAIPLEAVREILGPLLADPSIPKIAHNAKFDLHVLANAGMPLVGIEDTLLMAYLLAPGARSLGLDSLARQELGYEMQPITALIGKGKKQIPFSEVPVEDACFYAAEDAVVALRLHEDLKQRLEAADQWGILARFDLPLIPVLAEMERAGVVVDAGFLKRLRDEVQAQLADLEREIHTLAGKEFNLNAPRQVEEVLFVTLGLSDKGIRRTAKSGAVSTSAEQLAKLDHPVAEKMLVYRELEKLRSTYLEALPQLVREDGRVHTSYNQAVAATGRLSSSDPNLQNIPVRTEIGRSIRKAFVAPPGYVLVAADYSQIELRVLAHLSEDPALIEVYREGRDIHAQTASFLFGIPPEEVTKTQRTQAKTVNFGILYGMGPQRLARENKMPLQEAKDFIARYYASYPRVTAWMDDTLRRAHESGYVETLFGRRRYLPDLQGDRPQFVAQAERMAINHPVQGTAADLMKLAMLAVARRLEGRTDARLILQVHDELVLEVAEGAATGVATMVREEMAAAAALSVPLVVDVQTGLSWGELQPLA